MRVVTELMYLFGGPAIFITSQTQETSTLEIVTVVISLIAVIVTLITAVSSTKQSAFTQLEKVVGDLRKDLDEEQKKRRELEEELTKFKNAYRRAENFIRVKLPNEPLPNFFDTGPLNPDAK